MALKIAGFVLALLLISGGDTKSTNQQRSPSPSPSRPSPSRPSPSRPSPPPSRPAPAPSRPAPAPSRPAPAPSRPAPAPSRPAPAPSRPAPSATYRPAPAYTYRPAPAYTYRPAPSPTYRPAPSPTYRPAPSPTYRPAPAPTYKPPVTYRPIPPPTYRPAPTVTFKPLPVTPRPTYSWVTTARYQPVYTYTTRKPSAPTFWPQPPPTTQSWSGRPNTWPTYRPATAPSPWATQSPYNPGNRQQYPYPPPRSPGGNYPGNYGNPSYPGGQWGNQGPSYNYGTNYGNVQGQKSKTSGVVEKIKTALKNPSTQRALKGLLTKAFSSKKKTTHTNTRYGGMGMVYGYNNRPYYTSNHYGGYEQGRYAQPIRTGQGQGDTFDSDGDSFSFGGGDQQPVATGGVLRCVYQVPAGEAALISNDSSAQVRQIIFECAGETEVCCGLDCCSATAELTNLNKFINNTLIKNHGNLSSTERWNLTESLLVALEDQVNGTGNFSEIITIGNLSFNVSELTSLVGGSDDGRNEGMPPLPVSVDRFEPHEDDLPQIGVTVDRQVQYAPSQEANKVRKK